jgi:hypothetical protein
MRRGRLQRGLMSKGALTSRMPNIGPQLYLHDSEVLHPEIWPVRNDPKALGKPRGGFWTSSYDPEFGSAWVRWCVAYRYNEPLGLHWTVLSVPKSACVAVIDSPSNLAALIERYPRTLHSRCGLDFERLAGEYDGLHLTHEGYLGTRSRRSNPCLIGWDCETTFWFRWVFNEWHEVKPHFKDIDDYENRLQALLSPQNDLPIPASKRIYEMMTRNSARSVKS